MACARDPLPAQIVDSAGRSHIDYRAIFALAGPVMVNSTVQLLLTLSDALFIGHISTKALAAAGAVQWLIVCIALAIGGAPAAVQSEVAYLFGARCYTRAATSVWTALWANLYIVPIIVLFAAAGGAVIHGIGLRTETAELAEEFWCPRLLGVPFGVAAGAILAFFYSIGRPQLTLQIVCIELLVNASLNELLIFQLGYGIAGSAWASTISQIVALGLSLAKFLGSDVRRIYRSHLVWVPRVRRLLAQYRSSIPIGFLSATDLVGFAIFQLMQGSLGPVSGAASQVVAVLVAIAYVPGAGVAFAGTTLVGQSIGVGDFSWAKRIGSRVIVMTAVLTGGVGLILAITGPLVLPVFVEHVDPSAAEVVSLASCLLWIASGYMCVEGLYLGSVMCLRAVGDATVPCVLAMFTSCFLLIPLAHSFTFSVGEGWVGFLPQFGWATVGGWVALVVYVAVVGVSLLLRWIQMKDAPLTRKKQRAYLNSCVRSNIISSGDGYERAKEEH